MKKLLFLFFCLLLALIDLNAKMRIFTHVDTANFPPELRQNLEFHPWEKGFLDVTQPPYNAPTDGLADATASLQLAIDHAYACNLVVFVPHGSYLLSDQLQCYLDPGPQLPNNPISSASQRKFGHILLGSEKEGTWPLLKLKDGSNVKDNTLIVFKYFNSETGIEDASRHYLGSIRNFEIDMGNNPDISAVYNNGAQLCVIENLKIYGDFHKGISTLPGSGGYTANVEIIGGRIGIYQDNFRPNPTLFNIILTGQSECGLKVLDTRGSLTMAGFRIESGENPTPQYRAVYLSNDLSPIELGARANLNLVDGSIEVSGSDPAISSFQQDLVIKNVFFKASKLVESGTWSGQPDLLSGKADSWQVLPEYVYASGVDGASVYRDKQNLRTENSDFVSYATLYDSVPPGSLLTKHDWGAIPSWEDSLLVDLVLDYQASPDDESDDDALALQKAIDDLSDPGHEHFGKTLFIPRGHYHIKSEVLIRAGVKIIGAAKNISVIMVSEQWHPGSPVSALRTEHSPGAGIVLSDLAIVGIYPSTDGGLEGQKYISILELSTGNSIIRDVQTSLRDIKWNNRLHGEPLIQFTGHAGGKVYGLCVDEGTRGVAEPGYRLVNVKAPYSPLTFYQISVEDASEEMEEEQTLHMEIDSSAELTIFGFKYEKESELLHVSNTGRLTIIGGSGNYGLKDPDDEAIISIENTPYVFIGNISRRIQDGEIPGKAFLRDGDLSLPGDAPIALYVKVNESEKPEADTFQIDFIVTGGEENNPLTGAEILLSGDSLYTGEDGRTGTYLESGTYFYSVSAMDHGEYSDSVKLEGDTLISIHFISSALDRPLTESFLILYPNPAGEQLTIHFDGRENTDTLLQIYDMKGRAVSSIPIQIHPGLNEINISLTGLHPGPYLLRLQDRTHKFMINKS